jgi:hypothetical protein
MLMFAASGGNNGSEAHTRPRRGRINWPHVLDSLGPVDESALKTPAGSAAGQALQGEGAGSTQLGDAEAPAADEMEPAASAVVDAGEAPPRPRAPSAHLWDDVGAIGVSTSTESRNLAPPPMQQGLPVAPRWTGRMGRAPLTCCVA